MGPGRSASDAPSGPSQASPWGEDDRVGNPRQGRGLASVRRSCARRVGNVHEHVFRRCIHRMHTQKISEHQVLCCSRAFACCPGMQQNATGEHFMIKSAAARAALLGVRLPPRHCRVHVCSRLRRTFCGARLRMRPGQSTRTTTRTQLAELRRSMRSSLFTLLTVQRPRGLRSAAGHSELPLPVHWNFQSTGTSTRGHRTRPRAN